MNILGINAYHGDASAALVVDGALVAAAEEERFTRVKHCAGFPARASCYKLDTAGAPLDEEDGVASPDRARAPKPGGRRLLGGSWFSQGISGWFIAG